MAFGIHTTRQDKHGRVVLVPYKNGAGVLYRSVHKKSHVLQGTRTTVIVRMDNPEDSEETGSTEPTTEPQVPAI